MKLLIKVIQTLLKPVGISLSLFCCVSPFLLKVRSRRWQRLASDESSNIICHIIGLVFSGVTTDGPSGTAIYQEFLKVSLQQFTKQMVRETL